MRVPLIVMMLLLAGCTSDDGGSDARGGLDGQDTSADADASEGAGIAVPVWQVGQWWSYRFSDGETRTFIVTEAGDGYRVDVDAEDFAFTDAALSDISTIGAISSDLDGSQDSSSVNFFEWPLAAGDTWDLTWDGQGFVTEVQEDLSIVAVAANGTRVYALDEEAGWFSYIRALDGSGEELWSAELVDSGLAYSGTYVRYEIGDVSTFNMDGSARNGAGTLQVPEGTTDIWIGIQATCSAVGNIVYSAQPEDPEGQGFLLQTPCPIDMDTTQTIDPVVGQWRITHSSAGVEGFVSVIPRTLIEASL